MKQKEQEIAHLGNRTKSAKPLISPPIWNSPGLAHAEVEGGDMHLTKEQNLGKSGTDGLS